MANFKARARALDMLGRQQIAGIPTAISELFKNAHDAYADNVIVDYFRTDRLFVLRDDGLGMTEDEFQDRWLTLGTESKLKHANVSPPPKAANKPERPIMGEKGIGRLAIAIIGDHVLVLTRAKRKNKLHDIVMAFVYWKMFEIPGLNLEEVVIPLKTIPGGKLPSSKDFDFLVNKVIDNILDLQKKKAIAQDEGMELLEPLENFSIVADKIDGYLEGPSLKDEGHGTHFIICPAYNILEDLIDGDQDDKKATPLLKALLGFSNTMFPDSEPARINTSFRDHRTDEYYEDHIKENEFWTADEYEMADHIIKGTFDEYGQFKGNIKVYDKEIKEHIITWPGAKGLKTACGPFTIDFAYFQGEQKYSSIPPEEWATVRAKLERISGIYLFKNGIRILPYGDNQNDFLDIELNRNKSAGYYFFSYRRMFGAIEIKQENNPNLQEKAGREGLRENTAYRQLIKILKNFFVQLAADFFRDPDKWGSQAGPLTDIWSKERNRLERMFKAKQKYEKKARARKEKFRIELDKNFERLNKETMSKDVDLLLKEVEDNLKNCLNTKENDKAASQFLAIESEWRKNLYELKDSYSVSRPKGITLNKILQQDYRTYQNLLDEAEQNVFKPGLKQFDDLLDSYQNRLQAEISRRKRLEIAINNTVDQYKKSTSEEVKEVNTLARKISGDVIDLSKQLVIEFDNKVRNVQADLAKINPYELTDQSLVDERSRLENELIEQADEIRTTLENIRLQLDNIVVSGDISGIDYTEALAEELETLKEKIDADLELSQLGLAVSAIQHEFQHTVKVLRQQIRRLKAWADVNEGLDEIYTVFRTNFEHLDNYLTLFTPLNRRLYRKQVEIYGSDVFEFVKDVFFARMDANRHDIQLECSKTFSKKTIMGFPSTFYPVFINVVDNAIFWLKDRPKPRKIMLDADEKAIYISNNGPEIDVRDKERIFEIGFSRRPLGRGMGLYISKQVLNKVGYDILLDKPKLDQGVTFKIEPMPNEK